MTAKVVKSTSRGQITLPVRWRDQFNTDNYLIEMRDHQLVVKPLFLGVQDDEEGYEAVWSAEKDNGGKGLSAEEMIRMIKKIRNEQDREIPPEID